MPRHVDSLRAHRLHPVRLVHGIPPGTDTEAHFLLGSSPPRGWNHLPKHQGFFTTESHKLRSRHAGSNSALVEWGWGRASGVGFQTTTVGSTTAVLAPVATQRLLGCSGLPADTLPSHPGAPQVPAP